MKGDFQSFALKGWVSRTNPNVRFRNCFVAHEALSGLGPPHYRDFPNTHTRHTALGRTPLEGWSARRRDLNLTRHNAHNRQNIRVPGEIRTLNTSKREAADPRLETRGHWNRLGLGIWFRKLPIRQTQWASCLGRGFAAARLVRSWVCIPPEAWMSVCCECCVLSGRGLCDELITRPEESYRLWCVAVCDLETSWMVRP